MEPITLQGKQVTLRALEPEDIDLLFQVENDLSIWELSNTQTPFSKHILKQYLANAHQDIYEAKQLRLVIENTEASTALGFIDLFDFDPKNRRVGVGVLLLKSAREKGYATDALNTLSNYVFRFLQVHQIYANITTDNSASISLFEKQGFVKIGVKKDWNFSDGKYKDELLYQYIKE